MTKNNSELSLHTFTMHEQKPMENIHNYSLYDSALEIHESYDLCIWLCNCS